MEDDLREQLGTESREHMRLLQGRVHRMEALIDGILTYARANRRLNAPELVDTGALVHEAIELLALPAPPYGIRPVRRLPCAHRRAAAGRISTRVRANVAEQIGGRGIGLTSVQQIVEAHGGTVAVESREGLSSTFTVTLPA